MQPRRPVLPLLALLLPWSLCLAQKIERLDPLADRIFPADAQLVKAVGNFNKWTEGPVWVKGTLYFAEIPANKIDRWQPNGAASVFMYPSGYTGSEPYPGPEPGSNGMTLDTKGRLTVAGHARRNVWRLESLESEGRITVLADAFQGKKLNSPNDLVYRSDGSLYFTDPPYGLPTQSDQDPLKEQPLSGVYRIPHAVQHKPGAPPDNSKLELLISDLPRPNGIAFSPDEKTLYVSDSGKKIWMRYDVSADGKVTHGTLFCNASGVAGNGSPDGIKVDSEGNLYGSGPGGVWIISQAGKHIATIPVPETAANLAWGDADGKTLYITASTSIYSIRLNAHGLPLGGH